MIKKVFLLVCLSLCSWVVADDRAELLIPKDLNVLFVNGEKQRGNFFNTRDKNLKLPGGQQRLVLQYEHFFGDDDDYDHAKSEPFLLKVNLAGNQKYQLHIPEMNNYQQAKAFMHKPELTVIEVASEIEVPVFIGKKRTEGTFVEELAGQAKPEGSMKKSDSTQALEQLLYWWGKADGEQRQQFLQQVLSK